ncbi:MAG: DEAD/DEAH box helicase [Anaerolineales bacterium]|nr:DEAD/DEAH box helicase [Anaerolineales bacterium]
MAAMPLLLDGDNLILAAPTASGKTEAALAPLIERYLPAGRTETQLTILYLLPTRALIADLWRRLATPLDVLRVAAAVKTHDLNTFNPTHPAELLLTTPESLDALLAGHPKSLAQVRAVIIDELHGLDGTVRGDQLRVVLNRLRHLRTYAGQVGDAADAQLQYVGISATLAAPETTAARYLPAAQVVTAGQPRTAALDEIALDPGSPAALLAYLDTFRARGWRKALVFATARRSRSVCDRGAGCEFRLWRGGFCPLLQSGTRTAPCHRGAICRG